MSIESRDVPSVDADLARLEVTESIPDRQRIFNEMFPLARREQMLTTASVDSKGRKVLYYRAMPWEKVFDLLQKSRQTPADYWGDVHEPLSSKSQQELKYFLLNYYNWYLKPQNEASIENNAVSMKELLELIFKDALPHELAAAIQEANYSSMMPLIRKYINPQYLKNSHTGSVYQKFSPYLSMSVGGPVMSLDHMPNYVYVEMIVPDDKIIIHPHGCRGEKEVFIEELQRDYISRVYTQPQLREEVVLNPSTIVGAYHQDQESNNTLITLQQWRWDEKTEDCLPPALAAHADWTQCV